MKPAIGQYWKDTINGDLLKVLGIVVDDENGLTYVRCASFVLGKQFLGVQEMKAEHLNGERFILVRPWFWTRRQLTRQLYGPQRQYPPNPQQRGPIG